MRADYTELWISSPVVPLVLFADCVRSISSTRLDMVGLGETCFPDGLVEQLHQFDEIVCWYGSNRIEFQAALHSIHPRCEFLQALPSVDWRGHATDFFSLQVGAPSGLIPRIDVERAALRQTVAVHPFSGSVRKNWPIERYRELAKSVAIDWIAGPEDKLEGAVRFNNLMDLARWLSGARAYLGNDSGISHLASAVGVPSLILFGDSDPERWAPRGKHVRVLRHCLTELDVEAVSRGLTW